MSNDNSIKETFGRRLMYFKEEKKRALNVSKYTDEQLAEDLDEKLDTVKKWLSGASFPRDLQKLEKIADVLGCDVPSLLGSGEKHEGNKYISQEIGLSEESIEVLRYLNTKLFFSEVQENEEETLENMGTLAFLNFLLEGYYPHVVNQLSKEEFKRHSVPTILEKLNRYVYSDYIHLKDDDLILEDGFSIRIAQRDILRQVLVNDIVRSLDYFRELFNEQMKALDS